jgi:hypothetical protein
MDTQQSKINPTAPGSTSGTPETPNRGEYQEPHGRLLGGLIIVAIGGVFLARELGVYLPYWLFSWEMLIIVIGLFIGAKHNFRSPHWLIPVGFGTAFLINHHFLYFDFWRYFWPVLLISVGLLIILRGRGGRGFARRWEERNAITGSEDVIESVTIFGGVKKNIISKDFRGGETVTVFGGTELNLMQADSKDKIVLELVQVFGGTKLLVPPHWKIQTEEMVTIFGGLNDKRPIPAQPGLEEGRILVIKGVCIFGGIDIKSF